MTKYLFLLGRHSELSKLECFSLLESLSLKYLIKQESREFLVLEMDNFNAELFIQRSGAVIKIAKKIDVKDYTYQGTSNSVNYGISILGNPGHDFIKKIASEFKQKYKDEKVKASLKMPKHQDFFTPSEVSSKRLEDFLILNKELFQTIATSDPESYKYRDEKRPEKNFKMQTSIRLAKILINISQARKNILDPFCGYGTILQEALLCNIPVYGFEFDEKIYNSCIKNLEWISKKYTLITPFKIYNLPNSKIKSTFKENFIETVVTEPEMGPYFKRRPDRSEALKIIPWLEKQYTILFRSLKYTLGRNAQVVIILPEINYKGGKLKIDMESILGSEYTVLTEKYGVKLPIMIEGQVFDRYIYILRPSKQA